MRWFNSLTNRIYLVKSILRKAYWWIRRKAESGSVLKPFINQRRGYYCFKNFAKQLKAENGLTISWKMLKSLLGQIVSIWKISHFKFYSYIFQNFWGKNGGKIGLMEISIGYQRAKTLILKKKIEGFFLQNLIVEIFNSKTLLRYFTPPTVVIRRGKLGD